MRTKEFKTKVLLEDGTYEECTHEFAGGSDRECKQASINSVANRHNVAKSLVTVVKLK